MDGKRGIERSPQVIGDQRSAHIVKFADQKSRSDTNVVQASEEAKEVEESSTSEVDLMEVVKERLQHKIRARATPQRKTRKPAASRVGELKSKDKAVLYEMAQSKDIHGPSKMSKAKLIDALVGRSLQ